MTVPIIACRIVEVCVFRFVQDHPQYLLLKRSNNEEIYPGLWQFISGSIHDKEKATEAALREMYEETGLTPRQFWVVPHVNTYYDHAYDAVNLSPFFAAQVMPDDEPALSKEHQHYEWLRYHDARRKLVWPGQRQGLDIVKDSIIGGEAAGERTRVVL
ncbi:MAG: dATP pyrophosphohydrolase [Bacteroidetes bacterium]|nr:dATP pyrophosphohydrolase [Bacteroidota bacterium]